MAISHLSPFLTLALLATLSLSLPRSDQPIILATTVTVYPQHMHSTGQVFDLHLGSYFPNQKVVHGLKNMQWPSQSLGGMGGWQSRVLSSNGHHRLHVDKLVEAQGWLLYFSILVVQPQSGIVFLQQQKLSLAEQQTEGQRQSITLPFSVQQNQKSEESSVGQNNGPLRPFLLLSGMSTRMGIHVQLNLNIIWSNSTHLILSNQFAGLSRITYTLLLFQQTSILERSFILSFENASESRQNRDFEDEPQLISSFGLKAELTGWISQISSQKLIIFKPIECPAFWSQRRMKCVSLCLLFEKVGKLRVCLMDDRILECDDVELGNELISNGSQLDQDCSDCSCGPSYETVSCPGWITNCQTCIRSFANGQTTCQTCISGYYATTAGLCQVCTLGCATCTRTFHSIRCTSCVTNFVHTGSTHYKYKCECSSNQYTDTSVPQCLNCPTGCSSCSSNTVCTSCIQAYFLNAGNLCVPCMPVCSTCSSATTCSSCVNNLAISGTTCVCSSPTVLDPGTTTCISCTSFDPNCQNCGYNPSYSDSSPNPIVCSVANVGYYVTAGGLAAACGEYCDFCSSPSTCTSCQATFFNSAGSCICSPSPLSHTNTIPSTCDNCFTIIAGCSVCARNTGVTECSTCLNKYFPTTTPPTASCSSCRPACADCTDYDTCGSCQAWAQLSVNECICPSLSNTYLNVAGDRCANCSLVIAGCSTCSNTVPTLCTACNPGSSTSVDSLLCYACPLNCLICNAAGVCLTCTDGYLWNSTHCECQTTCINCGTLTAGACSACSGITPDCTACSAGFYLVSTTCTACLLECSACVDASSCISCKGLFVLGTDQLCHCNNTASLYLSIDTTTCQSCAVVVVECLSCTELLAGTFCNECIAGKYYDTVSRTCLPCTSPCLTCNGMTSTCTSCVSTYILSVNSCVCDHSFQMFYSSTTLGCVTCLTLIPNCATCAPNGVIPSSTDCSTCADPYYVVSLNTCVKCDVKCTQCSGPTTCTACATNLIVNGANFCACDIITDASLYYYAATNQCYQCVNFLSNCLTCQPDPLACTLCQDGTYISGSVCLACPSQCLTCNSTSCISCPVGTTLNGTICMCDANCSACQVTSPNCLNCTIDSSGVTTQCSSCQSGFELASDGVSCSACPAGCATCSNSGLCTTCLDSFILTGNVCECDAALDIFNDGSQCRLCAEIFNGCQTCSYDGSATSCTSCVEGMFLNGTVCGFCSPSCLACSAETVCTSCHPGIDFSAGTCSCGVTCSSCSASVAQCSQCTLTIFGAFSQCTACSSGSFLDGSNLCPLCSAPCVECDSSGSCTSCAFSLEVIGGTCICNSANNLILNTVTSECELCYSSYPYCQTCQANVSISFGYQCILCSPGYYWSINQTCQLQVCGDGIITPSQQCDDSNDVHSDGCYMCKVEQFYNCTGQPSICVVEMGTFTLTYDSSQTSTTECNKVIFFFKIEPAYDSYNNADFDLMLVSYTSSRIDREEGSGPGFIYSKGRVGYKFQYSANIVGAQIRFLFTPRFLGVAETLDVPLYPIFFNITESINTVPLRYIESDVCSQKTAINQYINAIEYTSYGVLVLSALPAKVVGLELFGVLQLTFLSLASVDELNPLMSSLTLLSSTNGLAVKVDSQEPTNARRLQTSAATPDRVQTIGYASNFIRNCNVMLLITCAVLLVAFFLFLLTCCCHCCPCLAAVASRFLKELVLTLVLFSCFNFAYCAGLHFTFADKSDGLYALGTLAAVAALLLPLGMVLLLQCSEEEGFGEYKQKMKPGRVERGYFVVTILYRMGIGFYLATMNNDDLSTLIVLLLSILFLLYNLVNLPFGKAYHNYRACLCHFSQFLILYLAMYFRTMANPIAIGSQFNPVYVELAALGVCLLVSLIVLVIEICIWVGEVRVWCSRRSQRVTQNETQQAIQSLEDNRETIENKAQVNEMTQEQLQIYKMFS